MDKPLAALLTWCVATGWRLAGLPISSHSFRCPTGLAAYPLVTIWAAVCCIWAAEIPQPADLLQLSLEDLGKIKVTTVSRKTEPMFDAPAAIQVITQEEIRRSGVNVLPEALRMAPGLNVARANSRKWAISARGFNQHFSNKLLVLMDGRTLYTPLFSGVFWEEVDTVLEDIDRIEVIRGPGAALWGANAVNGVINILTKGADQTQGLLLSGGGGDEERVFGTVRYGGQISSNLHYRVYSKYSDRDESTFLDGSGGDDAWWMSQTGFRLDWKPTEANHLTLQGDHHHGELGARFVLHTLEPPWRYEEARISDVEELNVLGRWTHSFSAESDLSLQAYYEHADRWYGILGEVRDTLDVDAQHRFQWGDRQEIIWGAGYRYSEDEITETPDFQMRDPRVGVQLVSAFVQDGIALVPDRLTLTLGTKVEHHDFTGFEVQPSGRLVWTPSDRQTIWGAVSRAVRTPSRVDRDFAIYADASHVLPSLPIAFVTPALGNRDLRSEELVAYELGYRLKVHPRLTLDSAVFYNVYDRLQGVFALPPELRVSSGPAPVPYLLLPHTFRNHLYGETYGAELSATWQPFDIWRLRAGYTFLQMQLHTRGPVSSLSEHVEGDSPDHQFFAWSDLDIGRHVEWGVGVRYVDALPARLQQVPSYTELETRLAWRPNKHCEFAIVGSNLIHARHQEFSPLLLLARNTQVDRAVFAKVTIRF